MDILGMTITLGSLCTICTVVIALSNFFGNRNKKAKDEEARLVRIESMLTQIEQNTSNLNQRVENHDHLLTRHESRLAVVESKVNIRKGGK